MLTFGVKCSENGSSKPSTQVIQMSSGDDYKHSDPTPNSDTVAVATALVPLVRHLLRKTRT
jgi:hypothetical protein